ncbi:MAG: maltose alpha-D-glucosyltransferase [Rhodospirillales bacterium]|nr:maltose alpha-D-glucosyltransferase [Rhodospirillales bacterium]
MLADDPLWYKDAIIYEMHVRSFFDANNDGIGDFVGLTRQLDYIQDLGVNTIWLLPFYASPLRDDGYDISDFHAIHPNYGTRDDFKTFINEAHHRGLRVITELVINHTSDQHPWFKASRNAPAGSAKRDYYLWSDSKKKFPETRIIFTDSETSNWAWDDTAKAYYWHRFFSHQPDLNHNNPHVVRAVTRLMRYWLDIGVDGLRLDAIPYLCVREGTNNENLPETHEVIKQFRKVIDSHYKNRMLLAEANQWPEDVCEYFGDGDECHMAYHFPLMPRIYMALAQEDRHPVIEILNQTPDIPSTCQWAIFLRNHDELTLEMVTKKERDYLYEMYANDQRMRVNVGIRRRLAPLMDNDRRKIELVVWLLMTMPGSPVIYYGDEIGMGDNIYLGDRNGVRTPMQWSPDRNAGFSRADPQKLFLPPVMDPVYGYEAVNVEAQSRNATSLLNWYKRVIALRKSVKAFGRGKTQLLRPGNRKVLAYLRTYEDEIILCVANLSRIPQAVEIDLSQYSGHVLVDLIGRTSFPPANSAPYLLTLSGYGFFVFRLDEKASLPTWHEEKRALQEPPILVLLEGWRTFFAPKTGASVIQRAISGTARRQLQSEVLIPYIASRPWFAAKGHAIEHIEFTQEGEWSHDGHSWLITLAYVVFTDIPAQSYFLPLAIAWDEEAADLLSHLAPWTLARIRQKEKTGILYGAFGDDSFCAEIVKAIGSDVDAPFAGGQLEFRTGRTKSVIRNEDITNFHRPAIEQTNTNVIINNRYFLKGYRRLHQGVNPEAEMGLFLSGKGFAHVAQVVGSLEYRRGDGTVFALALLQDYVTNQGDGWSVTQDYLQRYFLSCLTELKKEPSEGATADHSYFLTLMQTLGGRVGEMHLILDQGAGNPDFEPLAFHDDDFEQWAAGSAERARQVCSLVEASYTKLLDEVKPAAEKLLSERIPLFESIKALRAKDLSVTRIRHHGHLKLDQVLLAEGDFVIIDFGGDPDFPIERRRMKHTPFRDVAGILYSLHCAGRMAARNCIAERPDDRLCLEGRRIEWEGQATTAFMKGYEHAAQAGSFYPADANQRRTLIDLSLIDLMLDQIIHKAGSHYEWLDLPLDGLMTFIHKEAS